MSKMLYCINHDDTLIFRACSTRERFYSTVDGLWKQLTQITGYGDVYDVSYSLIRFIKSETGDCIYHHYWWEHKQQFNPVFFLLHYGFIALDKGICEVTMDDLSRFSKTTLDCLHGIDPSITMIAVDPKVFECYNFFKDFELVSFNLNYDLVDKFTKFVNRL